MPAADRVVQSPLLVLNKVAVLSLALSAVIGGGLRFTFPRYPEAWRGTVYSEGVQQVAGR